MQCDIYSTSLCNNGFLISSNRFEFTMNIKEKDDRKSHKQLIWKLSVLHLLLLFTKSSTATAPITGSFMSLCKNKSLCTVYDIPTSQS